MRELHPTIFIGVPRVYSQFQLQILQQVASLFLQPSASKSSSCMQRLWLLQQGVSAQCGAALLKRRTAGRPKGDLLAALSD